MNSELSQQILSSCQLFEQKYRLLFTLGKGRYSKVKLAIPLHSKRRLAIKLIRNTDPEIFLKEIDMMLRAAHPSVIQLLDAGIGAKYISSSGRQSYVNYIVMPLAQGGELFKFVNQTGKLSEELTRFFFKSILKGLQSMHCKGIAHRDIKSENILLQLDFQIKIADFGFAVQFFDSTRRKFSFDSSQKVGSPNYNSPQQIDQLEPLYDAEASDVFSAGVVLFEMMFCSSPFKSSGKHDQYYRLLCKPDKSRFWNIFASICVPSKQFKDLIQKMLDPNPSSRIRVSQIAAHSWLNRVPASFSDIQKDIASRLAILEQVSRQQRKLQQLESAGQRKGSSGPELGKGTALTKQQTARFQMLLGQIRKNQQQFLQGKIESKQLQ